MAASLSSSSMFSLASGCFYVLFLLGFSRYAVSQSIVRHLPGFDGPLPFELETGFVSVDDSNDVNLFYYFVKSENKPSEDPLIVWFSGGPGCSVLTALAFEFGPLLFKVEKYNGSLPTLVTNPHRWTKVANIIFLDAPVGTGYSYSRSFQGSYTSDTKSAEQTYTFIRKWLLNHPEFLSNPLYVGGDSYSGKTVPIVVQDISDGIQAGDKPLINLKGYLVGNPTTDYDEERNSRIPFSHGMGLISDELFESAKKNCQGNYINVDPHNTPCIEDVEAISECTSGLNNAHILEPKCVLVSPKTTITLRKRSTLEENENNIILSRPATPGLECRSYGYMLSYYWANDITVKKALNIEKVSTEEWIRCKYIGGLNYLEDVEKSTQYHANLIKRNYRSLIYNGDHDMLVPFLSTQTWIRSLNYSISDDWRPWSVEGQIAGYTRTYMTNMTYATIKGGGHTAPEYKPKECLSMVRRWLSYEPL
ncbi:sinapoylglucose--choline O-sinapoyltransferase [Ranunculus cassubicifolius]